MALARFGTSETLTAPILIAAHGSWERDPADASVAPAPRRADMFGFKATFCGADIAPGLLPVLGFASGYGGMMLGDHQRTTLAFCIRSDALRAARARHRGLQAALVAAAHVQAQCAGVRRVLATATLQAPWLSVGPIRPVKRRSMSQRFLRYVLIVEDGVAGDGRGQLFTAVEARGGLDVADAAIEAFNHAVGLRVAWRDQAVLNAEQHALSIERVLARRFLLLADDPPADVAD